MIYTSVLYNTVQYPSNLNVDVMCFFTSSFSSSEITLTTDSIPCGGLPLVV